MPKVLIVAATRQEIEPFLNRFRIEPTSNVGFFVSGVNPHLAVLITGVGMVNTAYYMGRYFLSAFNYTINAGICGAFNNNIKIGEVVKSYILKKSHSQPISKTAPIVFIERYYDLVGIILISLIGIWFVNLEKIIIILLFIGAVSILVISQRRDLVESVLKKISTIPILKKYLVNILSTFDSIHVLLRPRIYTKGIAYSILAWGIESLAVYMIFQGFKIELDFPIVVLIFTLSTIIGGLSMLPGGIGVTEGGMLGLLLLHNIDYTVAFGLVLMVRVFTLWFSVIIGIIFLKFKI